MPKCVQPPASTLQLRKTIVKIRWFYFRPEFFYVSAHYKCFKIDFLESYICNLTFEKNIGDTAFHTLIFFILSEWRDKGVTVATWEENNMAAQKWKL